MAELDALESGLTSKSAPGTNGKPPEAKPATEGATDASKAKSAPETAKPDAGGKPAEAAKTDPDDKPATDGGTEPESGDKDPTAKFHLAHDLRKELRRQFTTVEKLQGELNQLREQAKKPDTQQTTMLVEENKKLKARLDEMDQELRYVEYTKSEEFKEKFQKPFENALNDAYEEVKELMVKDKNGDYRPATPKDFNDILDAPAEGVRELADNMFGEYSSDARALRRKLVDLRRNADREAKRYREEAKTRESQKLSEQVEQRETMEKLWKRANEQVVEKYPQYFQKVEGDDEINAALEKGYAAVDKAHDPQLPTEEKVERLAVLRHKAAAFPAEVLRRKRAEARVKELEGIVAEYEKSEPGEGKRPGGDAGQSSEPGAPEGYEPFEQAFDKFARQTG